MQLSLLACSTPLFSCMAPATLSISNMPVSLPALAECCSCSVEVMPRVCAVTILWQQSVRSIFWELVGQPHTQHQAAQHHKSPGILHVRAHLSSIKLAALQHPSNPK